MAQPRDYYEVLGVSRNATADEIRKAYRKLARQWHPDVNKAADAAKRFAEVSDAYEVLSSEEKRKQYDQFGHAGVGIGASGGQRPGPGGVRWEQVNVGGGGGFDSIFEEIFGGRGGASPFGGARPGAQTRSAPRPGPVRGPDIRQELPVSFMTAAKGGSETLRLSMNGQAAQAIEVKIPAGTNDGAKLRLKGKGQPGQRGGPAGDLILTIKVGAHPHFRRDGLDVYVDVPINLSEAALGTTVNVPLIYGRADVKVPAGASSGRKLRIKGMGITAADGKAGDFYAVVQIIAPQVLSERAEELLDQLERELENPRIDGPWG